MRIEATLAVSTQLFPLGTQPPEVVRLTLTQGGEAKYTEDFPFGPTLSTEAEGVGAGDYVAVVQAFDKDGAPVGDADSRSLTLLEHKVELPVPTFVSLAAS